MYTDLLKRVVIREARPEDDAVVGELLVEAFLAQYAKKFPEVVYTEERKRSLRDVAGKRAVAKVLVAEVDGRVVGTVALWPPGAPGTEAWLPDAADLRHLATSVEFHGQGLSAPLLDEAERVAREDWRVSAICLHVRRGVQGVARMYQRRGFIREPSADLDTPSVFLEAFVLRFPQGMDGCFRLRFTAPMTPHQAEKALANAEVVPCAEMQLADARKLVEACLAEGVPALVHREACSKPSCSPKFQVLVRPEDAPRVAGLLQQRWMDSLQREGLLPEGHAPRVIPEDGELPCPACGTAAPLVEGACSDCGLQLE